MIHSQNVVASGSTRRKTTDFGVNVAGFIDTESGLGEGVRSTIRALDAAGIPRNLNNCTFNTGLRNNDKTYTSFSEENPYPINIIQVNADTLGEFIERFGKDYFAGKYNIGYWAWENLDFPREWFFAFSYFNEIWTPSSFCVEAISAVSPVPVLRVPHAIETTKTEGSRRSLNLPENKFIFLFIFDFSSSYERKNPLATIKSFKKAFGNKEDVLLVIKSSNSKLFPEQSREMKKEAEGFSNIRFIDNYLLRDEINSLISNCDCYVSLHRSEGFGLTLAEAMAYGKPVIATDYSANTDFMNVGNSFPVKYELITLAEGIGYFKKGTQWAEPSIDHACELMKTAFEDKSRAAAIGKKAAQDLKEYLSAENIGVKIKKRLERISYLNRDFEHLDAGGELSAKEILLTEQLNAETERLRRKLDIIESSKFWKIRNQWWRVKKSLGLTRYD